MRRLPRPPGRRGRSACCRGEPRADESGLLGLWTSATAHSLRPPLHLPVLWAGPRPRPQRREQSPAAGFSIGGLGATIPAFGREAPAFKRESCHSVDLATASHRAPRRSRTPSGRTGVLCARHAIVHLLRSTWLSKLSSRSDMSTCG